MRTFRFLAQCGALVWGLAALAGEPPPSFTLTDPKGDDHGDGALVYPLRDDLRRGDLDLLSVTARPEPDGTLFELTFARSINRPGPRQVDGVGTTLESVAKLGFHTFNVDIYIDTDRVPGTGLTATLPGRRAEIDPAHAWEKAICLTPRPFDARSALKRMTRSALARQLAGSPEGGQPSLGSMEERIFFPPRARVLRNTVRFVVPASFLGGAARPDWSYVVVVSGADIRQQRFDVQSFGFFVDEKNTGSLGILPISGGPSTDAFGGAREGDPLHPPIVDLIVPPGRSQEQILKDDDPASGRPVRLPGVVPGEPVGTTQTPDAGTPGR